MTSEHFFELGVLKDRDPLMLDRRMRLEKMVSSDEVDVVIQRLWIISMFSRVGGIKALFFFMKTLDLMFDSSEFPID